MRSADSLSRTRPTSVEPVKERFRTLGSWSIFETDLPVSFGKITLTTPSGTPARCRMSTTARAVSGVSVAGFKMVVQPAARAGPIFRVAIAAGKFHGVMRSETPIG